MAPTDISRRHGVRRLSRSDWLAHSDFLTVPLAAVALGMSTPFSVGFVVLFAAGAAFWSLVEYWAHRLMHDRRFPTLRTIHVAHHQHPRRPSGGTVYSTMIICALVALSVGTSAGPFVIGLLAGYFAFIALHFAMHAPRLARFVPPSLGAAHDAHHHAAPRRMFGVTTSVWDRAFGTYA